MNKLYKLTVLFLKIEVFAAVLKVCLYSKALSYVYSAEFLRKSSCVIVVGICSMDICRITVVIVSL